MANTDAQENMTPDLRGTKWCKHTSNQRCVWRCRKKSDALEFSLLSLFSNLEENKLLMY